MSILIRCNEVYCSNTGTDRSLDMHSVGSNYLSLNYQKSTTWSFKDTGIRKFEFVTKTQFLYNGGVKK